LVKHWPGSLAAAPPNSPPTSLALSSNDPFSLFRNTRILPKLPRESNNHAARNTFSPKFAMSVPQVCLRVPQLPLPICRPAFFVYHRLVPKSVELGSSIRSSVCRTCQDSCQVRDDSIVAGVGGVVLVAQPWESIQESRVIEWTSEQSRNFRPPLVPS